ncbi:lipoate-protein ligase B [Buchnera aphidicola BCc]|uniref:Octanoyltransferase n=2 Tax=Buchnera aphidicola TaxID=9 RepID=Q057Q8_BUCCC|nr:lipoate-protein ligase B [Buchnera aphidicola BCc]
MNIIIRNLGICNWLGIEEKMIKFTKNRSFNTSDELWCLEHYPVFTYGVLEKKKYAPFIHKIPVFKSNRGGKITFHGPGQLIIYLLIDLRRKKIKFYELVNRIEILIIHILKILKISSYTKKKHPGIYVKKKKICSLGFRIINGCSLHGISLNVNMDLKPFNFISPCGNKKIKMTQIKNFKKNITIKNVQEIFIKNFYILFNY